MQSIIQSKFRNLPALLAMGSMLILSLAGFVPAQAQVATPPPPPVILAVIATSSSSPATIFGTAEANSTISISGGVAPVTTTADASGNWNTTVMLLPDTTTHLSVTASNAAGTSTPATADVNFDFVAPVFASAPNVTATATTSGGVVVNFTAPTATDNVSGAVNVTCTPASGTVFAIGTTTVTCTASDAVGNTASTTFDVVVNLNTGSPTSTPPTLTITGPTLTNGAFCSTVSPLTISGLGTASSTVTVTGGTSTSTAVVSAAGVFSLPVSLNAGATTTLNLVTTDLSGAVLATTSLNVFFDSANNCGVSTNQPVVLSGGGGRHEPNFGNTLSTTNTVLPQDQFGVGGIGPADPGLPFSTVNPSVLALLPGIPNTGAGGEAQRNLEFLLALLGLSAIGLYMARPKKEAN